jgi:chromosome segregation protein
MDAPKYQKSDPAILLLNEIDILLTQTRLMELYLKQAQAAAADENVRLHEQYESELAALRADLLAKERQLRERPASAVDSTPSASVEQLQRDLDEKQRIHATTLERSASEIGALQKRIAELEDENHAAMSAARDANAVRDRLSTEIAAVYQEFENSRREFNQLQHASRETETGLRNQLQQLQNQVDQNQANHVGTADELRQAKQEIAALRQHLASLEALQDDLQANAARELEQARGRYENELLSLRASLTERDRTLLESQSALANLDLGLRNEIALVRDELEQKHSALKARDADLRAAKMQISALQQRVTELELAHSQATTASAELESIRRSLAEEVANLQHQVEVKESELTHRYEAVTGVELALHGRIQVLQQELARAQQASFAYETELETQRVNSSALQSRVVELERTQVDAGSFENIRQQLESDLNRLHANLAQKEYLIAGHERALASLEARSVAEIATLRQQLEQERAGAGLADQAVVQARSELAATRERLETRIQLQNDEIASLSANAASQTEQLSMQVDDLQRQLSERDHNIAELEARLGIEIAALSEQLARERSGGSSLNEDLRRARAELDASREAFEAQLGRKDQEIESLRTIASEQTMRSDDRVNELQIQLASKQLVADSRASELADLRTTIAQLREQLSEKNDNSARDLTRWQNVESQLNNEIAQSRAASEELVRAQMTLEAQLNQARSANTDLRGELQAAKNRAAEFAALLQTNEAAMTASESERDRLRISLEELAARYEESQADASRELAQVREGLESELTLLRSQLQQKSWSLAQQQASVENLAQIHREQIRKLEARLGEHQPVSERQSRELEQALKRADSLQQQIGDLKAELQRTQASAASQAEQIHQEYAARLQSANASLAAQSAELVKSGAARANVEESLRTEISRLNNEMQARTAALQSREDELDRVRMEMTSVQNRIVQFESITARSESEAREIRQAKSALEGDLAALRHELQHKSSAVAEQEAVMDELAARYRSQVEQLEANLRNYQNTSEERRREIEQAQAQIAFLNHRLEELQSALQQTELSANSRAEQLREEYEARVETLSREVAGNSAQLENCALIASDLEQALRGQIDRLIGEAQERNLILQNRNDELVRVKGELDSLSERFMQLESNAIQAENTASGDAERMRTEYQAQLALLQAELSQKEWALEERQAIIAGLEQEHRHQIDALHQQLAVKQFTASSADGEFVLGDTDLTELERHKSEKFADMAKAIGPGANSSGSLAPARRWHSGIGGKRRWRS